MNDRSFFEEKMTDSREFFLSNFEKSISGIYKHFYQKSEIDFLEQELYSLFQEALQSKQTIWTKVYSHNGEDTLLRVNLTCIVIVCNSMPFFAGKIRNLFHSQDIPIARSIQFHPAPKKEFYYIEMNSANMQSLLDIQTQIKDLYHKITILTSDYNLFHEQINPLLGKFNIYKDLLIWLLDKGFIWEGGEIFLDGKELFFGQRLEVDIKEKWLAFTENSSLEESLYARELTQIGFLEQSYLYFLGFAKDQIKVGIVGSFNQYASMIGINNFPFMNTRFQKFMEREKIEPFSGLGRSVRRVFNVLPPEILFLMPESSYLSLFQVIIEQSLRTQNHSSGFLIDKDLGILVTSIPRKNWEESKWEETNKIIENYLPNSKVKSFIKNLSNSFQGFHLIRSEKITQNIIFQITSQFEYIFISWIDLVKSKWADRFKEEPFPDSLVFRNDYIATHDPEKAVYDLELTKRLGTDRLILSIVPTDNRATLIQAITKDKEYPLSKWVNAFINLGLSPISQRVYRFNLENVVYSKIEFFFELFPNHNQLYERLKKAVYYIMLGKLPSDNLSSLILQTNLGADGLYFLKAVRDYCLQTNPYFNKSDFNQILNGHPEFSEALWEYFVAKFKEGKPISSERLKNLNEQAKTLREDEVLTSMRTATEAILRTDFFGGIREKFLQKTGLQRDSISFKIDSSVPSSLPLPRPFREIFVYSSQMMGIHLRGGEVARGGLRFSDRPSDFRTEILSLMKTQMVKNTVIVPVGSKGGFVLLKNYYVNQELSMVEAYKIFIRGLLAVTDNRKGKEALPFAKPEGPFAYDNFDPYLVVAADKGTAQLSDTANSISHEYEFWLGDAFASGGSKGYSHKEFGITAKGALVTADRQLRKLGIDYLNEPITVVGIGDMGGDVFGNGLLNSKYFKLVAAFNHKHIFLDPNPDPEKSYLERKRLFFSKESGWDAYDKKLISKGGGVYDKTQKSIPISPEVKKVLNIQADELSGPALISAILKAPVDLLYNGGIGTYVKSEEEENSEVGDPLNNEVRINGKDLNVKVVSEGGNLGFTQLGRIEYALKGGRIYTDALDNSAGVDLSDHEVNLKLLFSHLIEAKKILSQEERDTYLKNIAEEVCQSVLLDNALQSLAVDADEYESETLGWKSFINSSVYFISKGLLNPKTEKVPASVSEWEVWIEQTKKIPTPVLCVLLSYAKMDLYSDAIQVNLFQAEDFKEIYENYFPVSLQTNFKKELYEHPLKKEILLTQLVNFYINLMGTTGILLLNEKDKIKKMEKFHLILLDLYELKVYKLISEIALLRNKHTEKENVILLSKLRERVRAKWGTVEKINLSDFKLSKYISNQANEILRSI